MSDDDVVPAVLQRLRERLTPERAREILSIVEAGLQQARADQLAADRPWMTHKWDCNCSLWRSDNPKHCQCGLAAHLAETKESQ